jgi:hypothetical protein
MTSLAAPDDMTVPVTVTPNQNQPCCHVRTNESCPSSHHHLNHHTSSVKMLGLRLLPCLLLLLLQAVGAFVLVSSSSRERLCLPQSSRQDEEIKNHQDADSTRRSFLTTTATTAISITLWPASQSWAAVGTLPECQDTNVVLQGLTIKVTDPVQKNQMISFLQNAFDFEILRVTPDGSSTVRMTHPLSGNEYLHRGLSCL